MNPSALKFGCQTFTWEMLGDAWSGGPDDLVAAIADGGYAGIEITDRMIGSFAGRPADFARRLEEAGLALVAFAMGSEGGFTEPGQAEADLEATRRWVEFAARFPGAVVSMGSATVMSEGARAESSRSPPRSTTARRRSGGWQASPSRCILRRTTTRCSSAGRTTTGSSRLLEPQVGWVPDTGHILRGRQAIGETLAAHRDRIRYVHLKDVDAQGTWAMLGEGACDVPAVISAVRQAPRFNGWIVVEEESEVAASDPAAAVAGELRDPPPARSWLRGAARL